MAFPHDGKKFKKGESGNINGRPNKIPDIDTLLSKIPDSDYEAVIEALFKKAKKGDVRASEVLFDRSWGRPKEKIEVSGGIKSYKIVAATSRRGTDTGGK